MDRHWAMLLSYTDAIDSFKNDDFPIDFAFFTKALPKDQPMDQPTDQWTDTPSYVEMQ